MSVSCQTASHHPYISLNMYLHKRKKTFLKTDWCNVIVQCNVNVVTLLFTVWSICANNNISNVPSADFTKCLWDWHNSVVMSLISPNVLRCLLWISSIALVNPLLVFGSVMDAMMITICNTNNRQHIAHHVHVKEKHYSHLAIHFLKIYCILLVCFDYRV